MPRRCPPPRVPTLRACRRCPRCRRATRATRSTRASTRRSTRSTGSLVLEWRNTSDRPLSTFPFHLYWNAFRNNLSTTARGEGRARARTTASARTRSFGWIQVRRVQLTGPDARRRTSRRPCATSVEDGNADDRTVMEVRDARGRSPRARPSRFRVEWDALVPHGSVGRAGWVHDYNFVVQWFPKIGVFWKGAWNCHPFYPWTEFFADFGVYDVRLTLPEGLRGRRDRPARGEEGQRRRQRDLPLRAGGRARLRVDREPALPRAHEPLRGPRATRRWTCASSCSRSTRTSPSATSRPRRSRCAPTAPGRRPTPTAQITVVDPAWGSASGGMEYPTLFTGGASVLAPRGAAEPRGRHDPRGRATSSGTASWRTTSSRRPGSTRASTPT